MGKLHIDTLNRLAISNGWDSTQVREIDLRAGDTPSFDLHFYDVFPDARAPYALRRYQSAAISMQLLGPGQIAAATQNTWTEIVPAATAPTVTRVTNGDATHGEFDRITLASQPGSGFFGIPLAGGAISQSGATSATAKIYPGVTSPNEVAAAFARMSGAPWLAEFPSVTVVEIHGNAVANSPFVTAGNIIVSNLQYLFGWTASLDLTGAGVSDIASLSGDTPDVMLMVKLTPSGGAASTVLLLPVNLFL